MNYSAEQINKAFDKLPKLLSRAIFKTNIEGKKIEIVNKYKIHLDLATILSNYITFTLIGLMKMEDFGQSVKKDLGLSKEDSENIIKDVNETIFLAVRNKMKNLEEEDKLIKELQEQDMEIPIPVPPYAQKEDNQIKINIEKGDALPPAPNYNNSKSESEIYAQSGIEILNNENLSENTTKQEVSKILKDSQINTIEGKLNKPAVSDSIISDYTIPKMSNEKDINHKLENEGGKDIYREKI